MLAQLEAERRAVRLRVGGEERWIAADDAGLYRDALRRGAAQRAARGLHGRRRRDPWRSSSRRYARTHGPFTTGELRDRYRVDPTSALTALERAGELVRGELRPAGSEREWCDPEVLRRLRRASLAVLRKEIEAADQRALAALPALVAGRRPPSGRRRRRRPPARGARPAAGAGAARRRLGARRAAAPLRRLLPDLAGPAVRQRRGRVGRRGRPRTQLGPRGALLPRRRRGHRAAAQQVRARPTTPEHDLLRERLAHAPCFFTDLLAELSISPEQIQEALWDLVWAGEVTNDACAPLRAPRLTLARAQRARDRTRPGRRFGTRRTGSQAQVQGRWSLTTPLFRAQVEPGAAPAHAGRAAARALRHRHPRAGAGGGHPRRLLDPLRRARPARDARGVPARLLRRGPRRRAVRAAGRRRAPALAARRRGDAADRAGRHRSGAALRRRAAVAQARRRGRRRRAPPAARGGRLRRPRRRRARALRRARRARASRCSSTPTTPASIRRSRRWRAFVTSGRGRKLSLERVDGEPVVGSRWEATLIELGFRAGPRKLTLSA